MASVKIITNDKGTVLRNMSMGVCTTNAVDKAATALESIIHCELDIVHVEVDYEGCDDSATL